jgi:hypothetical protein
MIAGDHHHTYSRFLAAGDGVVHPGARRVHHSYQAKKGKGLGFGYVYSVLENVGQLGVRHSQYPQPPRRHRPCRVQNLTRAQLFHLVALQTMMAHADDALWRSFDEYAVLSVSEAHAG